MNEFDEFIADGFRDTLDVVGKSVTIRGVGHTANVGQLVENPDFVPGGETPRKICIITFAIPAQDFDPPLAKNERVATPYGSLQIVSFTRDSSYTVTLGDIFGKR